MGFTLRHVKDSACVIKTTKGGGQDITEFTASVHTALKNLWLDITIDISENPLALRGVLQHILKLQQLLAQHQKSLLLTGLKGLDSSDFVKRLRKDFGIEVVLQPPMATPPPAAPASIAQSVASKPKVATVSVSAAEGLPSAVDVEQRFQTLREQLGQALRRRRYLENESSQYKDRITLLSAGAQQLQIDQNQIKSVTQLENMLRLVRTKRGGLQREYEALDQSLTSYNNDQAKLLSEKKNNFKKEKEALEKKLSDLTQTQEKARGEFKKRTEQRREKLARLGTPK